MDIISGGTQQEVRPSVRTSSSSSSAADWLRLIEKLGDTQFGEVPLIHVSYILCFRLQSGEKVRTGDGRKNYFLFFFIS